MHDPTADRPAVRRLAIAVRGVVQGVGFRPFVYNAARSKGLEGWVRNEADTVRIEVQGEQARLDEFLDALRHRAPPQSRIESLEVSETECCVAEPFHIVASAGSASPRPTIPADLATCAECREEIRTASERRFAYPFTNCTNCGPRWSIIRELPYDRPRTSMAGFPLCPACEAEYHDPADRRFHAQPIACPACGPKLHLLDAIGREMTASDGALAAAVEAVLAGKVLALKGLGGFQLLVDATNQAAVVELRRRKRRPDKPLALMAPSLEAARAFCIVTVAEELALTSPAAPILLLHRREDASGTPIAEAVAPGNPYLGVMLPYTPLHHLFLDAAGRPLVCTSGNLSEEPMCIETEEAIERLGAIADLFLAHDRPIVRPVDDSVARAGCDGLQVLRRARGFAPLPLSLGAEGPTVLAVGGHLKNTVALALGSQVVASPHVGDLDNLAAVEFHQRTIRDLVDFFQVRPDAVACDLHPDYASTRYAVQLAAEWNVPLVRVQHHHAHVAAAMAEHRLEGPVLGLAWDGTGYGTDGVVWGGEALVCHGATFRRVAHLRPFSLPGGDQAVREPRRSALGVLYEFLGDEAAEHVAGFRPAELEPLLGMLARQVRCPRTTSMGRLFDAAAALCGLRSRVSFEGQAAMELEFAAGRSQGSGVGDQGRRAWGVSPTVGQSHKAAEQWAVGSERDGVWIADWEPLFRLLLADRAGGVPIARTSVRFHEALADLAVAMARHAGVPQVVLTGGCFQNALLASRARSRLTEAGFTVYTHGTIPPNDGGIAVGQAFVAARLPGKTGTGSVAQLEAR
ncbi:MAG: carbamoyltransferase HypF [Pirellulales bacterium]